MATNEPLDVGDRIEFSMTVEVTDNRGNKYWPKYGSSIARRKGETTEEAKDRIETFVQEALDRKILEIVHG